jgi:hypothetical protein
MNSLFQIIDEVHCLSTQGHFTNQDHDIIMEIESLLKLFNINSLRDIASTNANHIKALQL